MEAAAARYGQIAEQLDAARRQLNAANTQREAAADSPGFDEGHQRNLELAADFGRAVSWARGQQQLHKDVAGVIRNVTTRFEEYDATAHDQISSAKTAVEREAIINVWNATARDSHTHGITMIERYRDHNQKNYGSDFAALSGRLANLPAEGPGIAPTPQDQPGIPKPENTWERGGRADEPPQSGAGDESKPSTSADDGGLGSGLERSAGSATREPSTLGGDVPETQASTAVPVSPGSGVLGRSPSSSSSPPVGGTGMPGGLGSLASGAGSAGGGMPGGLSGLGSGNPLSSLASGGGLPGSTTPASGLPGVPGGSSAPGLPSSGVGDPSAALARGMSAGSGVAGSVSPMSSSPPMMGSSVPGSPGAQAGPAVGASSGPPAAPAGLAGAGAHTPSPTASAPPPVATGVPGAVAPAPGPGAMLPSPGMGAPAAPGGVLTPGTSTAATMPASSSGASSSGSSGGVGAGTASTTPTVIPGGVPTPAAGAARAAKKLGPDAVQAAAVAWALGKACEKRLYPVSWTVGVFRSSTASETVVMSSEGSGYVPEGVYLPRSVHLLVSDPLVDNEFRSKWFGWADPAEVLMEYASLRRSQDWALVAAATTARPDALRLSGVEYAAVNPYTGQEAPPGIPAGWEPPSLDDMHTHRLALEYPDFYDRLMAVANAESTRLNERVMFPLTQRLMAAALTLSEVPSQLRDAWRTVEANAEKSWQNWDSYRSAYATFAMTVGANSPGGTGGVGADLRPEDVPVEMHQRYRDLWKAARAMEFMLGWSRSPLPLVDMVYAAAVSGLVDIREALEAPLRAVEEDLR